MTRNRFDNSPNAVGNDRMGTLLGTLQKSHAKPAIHHWTDRCRSAASRVIWTLPWKGMEEAVKTYRVAYERDESGWWVASVRGMRGCHTQGRTVDEAHRRIVEAFELFVD